MEGSNEALYTNLREAEMKFKKACDQVVLLNDKLEGLQRRYDKARLENHRPFRYNLRLRMATVEGVRNAYYEYACEKAERIAEFRYEVSQLDEDSSDEEESDIGWDGEDGVVDEEMEEDEEEEGAEAEEEMNSADN